MQTRGSRVHRVPLLFAFILLTLALSLPASAQTSLTLPQAVSIALEKNPLRKAALADQRAASAGIKEARSGLLPKILFSESATRGNDPVYVFGTRLHQGRFTAADFALNQLNYPTPIGDFTTRFGGQWTLFDSFANLLKVRRAQKVQEAATRQLERTAQETVFRVIDAYYGLLLSMKQQQLTEQELKTAQSILEDSQNRFKSGFVVESDYLSAQVNSASRQQQLIQARNDVAFARARLNNELGVAAIHFTHPRKRSLKRYFLYPLSTRLKSARWEPVQI